MAGVNPAIIFEVERNDCSLAVNPSASWDYGFAWLDRLKADGVNPRDVDLSLMTIRFVLNPQELSDLTTLLVDHEIWTRNSIDRKILDGSNFFLEVGSESFTRKLSFNNTRIDLIDPLQSWIVKIANQKFAEGYLLTREHD